MATPHIWDWRAVVPKPDGDTPAERRRKLVARAMTWLDERPERRAAAEREVAETFEARLDALNEHWRESEYWRAKRQQHLEAAALRAYQAATATPAAEARR